MLPLFDVLSWPPRIIVIVVAMERLVANIRDNARWNPIMRKLGWTPEQLDAIEFDVKLPTS